MSANQGVIISDHTHPLKYVSYNEKSNSAYSGGFICNICRKNYGSSVKNFHCSSCEYDICDKCLYTEVDKDVKSKGKL